MKNNIPVLTVLFSAFLFLVTVSLNAQDTYKRNASADVESYVFSLFLTDNNNKIEGEAFITVDFKNGFDMFTLDLIEKSETFGMEVTSVLEDSTKVDYTYEGNKLKINPSSKSAKQRTYRINYKGVPERGLVIDTTKFGERSFFGDNWPNLARHWLPL